MEDLWTEDESEKHEIKIDKLAMPSKGRYVNMWNENGE